MEELENFKRWCVDHAVELLPHQMLFAELALTTPTARAFIFGGLGSGRTFVMETMERYANEQNIGTCAKTGREPKFLMYCGCGFTYRMPTVQRCPRCNTAPLRAPDNFDPFLSGSFRLHSEPQVSCGNCGPNIRCARCEAIQELIRRL